MKKSDKLVILFDNGDLELDLGKDIEYLQILDVKKCILYKEKQDSIQEIYLVDEMEIELKEHCDYEDEETSVFSKIIENRNIVGFIITFNDSTFYEYQMDWGNEDFNKYQNTYRTESGNLIIKYKINKL